MKYIIITPSGHTVAGVNHEHQCVTITRNADWTKLFSTLNSAKKFLNKYKDCGYGLSGQSVIKEASCA